KSHLIICICSLDVDILIFNGDIKHSTNKINKQELIELKYLYEEPVVTKIRSVIIKGNHDKLLKLSLRKVEIPIEVVENELKIGRYLFTHGHMEPQNTFDILVLSHEHPSFVLQGSVRERVKLPAFVTMQTEDRRNVIILPAANSISSGVNFPPKTKNGFLSPYLKRNAKLKTMRIFPFDYSTGVLPIPPIASWRGKRR
ncbi:MAG: metallophosphoesterase, partial [Candidatus Heimdallarchaeota archaeon]|nr:metallophosphoesterase [Candidatus Heimdallarchaeota archaeon]